MLPCLSAILPAWFGSDRAAIDKFFDKFLYQVQVTRRGRFNAALGSCAAHIYQLSKFWFAKKSAILFSISRGPVRCVEDANLSVVALQFGFWHPYAATRTCPKEGHRAGGSYWVFAINLVTLAYLDMPIAASEGRSWSSLDTDEVAKFLFSTYQWWQPYRVSTQRQNMNI